MNSTIELLKSHRSIRKFTAEPVPQAMLETLVEAGQAAATSSFIQACTLIQVNNTDNRRLLAEYAGNQAYVAEAPVFMVCCADMRRLQLACDLNDAPMQSGFTEQFITATADVALFSQNLTVAAESLGLGCVYIGGIRNNIAAVSELLNLPELVYPVFGLCIGYPDQNPEVKPRLPVSVVLKQDSYQDQDDGGIISEYDQAVREYYQTRTGGTKDMTWSGQMSGMLGKEARPHMLDFLQKKGFLLK
ncbi:oxygen-insensitive NADPH nitroreductase [Aliamphritea spongicola]|uniref:oxygen-insensitive NADPH nitroreductase n=1 Tax=Aliamphritea spongicola TaxID=707589 RepID=UPI00196A3CAD|nr:oxygen-insensitive NADPH nitroreductase [Aliamphritea spongicola]MBN3562787.1 oxygen-insensitive NADPH nitroreductase [Aliamphritea spongicola]